ncbi:hypothetical protein [Paraburkholderia diazotrophica]|uniref:hypothetical protein n=1 Tax=Paraburkholderia diazotrophica TaxID=667676 RepID=UPI00115FF49E|nr:hypothetical protein [Paraburkholderia diazotrophica]
MRDRSAGLRVYLNVHVLEVLAIRNRMADSLYRGAQRPGHRSKSVDCFTDSRESGRRCSSENSKHNGEKNALARCPAAKAKLHTLSQSVPEEKYPITLDRRGTRLVRTLPRIEAPYNATISSIKFFAIVEKCNFSFHILHCVQKDALKH